MKRLFVLLALSLAAYGQKLNFDPDWKFIKADPPNASAVDFDDSSWSNVSLPHTFNDVDTFDDWSTPNHVGEMNLWAGRTWYRKTFTLPDSMRGKEIFIEFEAVRQVAEVYLNGQAARRQQDRLHPVWLRHHSRHSLGREKRDCCHGG